MHSMAAVAALKSPLPKWGGIDDRLTRIFKAIRVGEDPDAAADRIGEDWAMIDIHAWNKRYVQCAACKKWKRKGFFGECDCEVDSAI